MNKTSGIVMVAAVITLSAGLGATVVTAQPASWTAQSPEADRRAGPIAMAPFGAMINQTAPTGCPMVRTPLTPFHCDWRSDNLARSLMIGQSSNNARLDPLRIL